MKTENLGSQGLPRHLPGSGGGGWEPPVLMVKVRPGVPRHPKPQVRATLVRVHGAFLGCDRPGRCHLCAGRAYSVTRSTVGGKPARLTVTKVP